jgi:hypothetical protein
MGAVMLRKIFKSDVPLYIGKVVSLYLHSGTGGMASAKAETNIVPQGVY